MSWPTTLNVWELVVTQTGSSVDNTSWTFFTLLLERFPLDSFINKMNLKFYVTLRRKAARDYPTEFCIILS